MQKDFVIKLYTLKLGLANCGPRLKHHPQANISGPQRAF